MTVDVIEDYISRDLVVGGQDLPRFEIPAADEPSGDEWPDKRDEEMTSCD